MPFTDDPVADYLHHDAQQCQELEELPECSECGEKIQDEYLYEVNDELICEECMNRFHRKPIEDYL